MKNLLHKVTLFSALLMTACASAENTENQSIELSNCAIQETIPGAKATGAFFTLNKIDDAPLSIVAAKLPEITDHVELHEMIMKDNKMIMSEIKAYPLKKGENIFKKGSYHIMLFEMKKPLVAGDKYNVTLVFNDNSEKTCHAVVKTVKELTPKHMKKMMHHKNGMKMEHKGEMKKTEMPKQ